MCIFYTQWLLGYKELLKNRNSKQFYIKRLFRIFPLYLIEVLGFAVLLVFFSTLGSKEYIMGSHFWKYIFWNYVTLNFLYPSLPGVFSGNAVNGALWTIKVELGFYLILPLIVHVLNRLQTKRKQNVFLLVIYVFSVLWNFLLTAFAERLGIPRQISYQLPGFMSFFGSGMVYVYNDEELHKIDRILIIQSFLLFVLHYFTNTEFLLPFVLTVIVMFLGSRIRFLSEIGCPVDYSYAMYLFHFPLITIFTSLGFFIQTPVFAILVIILSVLGMVFIAEKYIQQKLNLFIK